MVSQWLNLQGGYACRKQTTCLLLHVQVDADDAGRLERHPRPQCLHCRLLPGQRHRLWHLFLCDAIRQGRAALQRVPSLLPVLTLVSRQSVPPPSKPQGHIDLLEMWPGCSCFCRNALVCCSSAGKLAVGHTLVHIFSVGLCSVHDGCACSGLPPACHSGCGGR